MGVYCGCRFHSCYIPMSVSSNVLFFFFTFFVGIYVVLVVEYEFVNNVSHSVCYLGRFKAFKLAIYKIHLNK